MFGTLDRFTPNFIFKNENALFDHGLIIENELPEVSAQPKYITTELVGRNGELNEWHGDFAPFDYTIENVSVRYDKLHDVKRWLRGQGKLITHNDKDKYMMAVCNMGSERRYQNGWGTFYSFDIVFRCQPLKRKVRETFIELSEGKNVFYDPGDELAKPYLEIDSLGGDITISLSGKKITLLDTLTGVLTLDNELGKYIQGNKQRRSKGQWLQTTPGKNTLVITGKIKSAKVLLRSVFL